MLNIILSFHIYTIRALGKEFSHLLWLPYGLRCTLQCRIHLHNWYLVGMRSSISTKKQTKRQLIKQHKQALINKGNQKENHCRQSHVYHTGDKVSLKKAWKSKFRQDVYQGGYTITEVWNNRIVCTRRGNIIDTYNLHNITPFKD